MSMFNSAVAIFSLAVVGNLRLLHFSMSFLVSSENLLAFSELPASPTFRCIDQWFDDVVVEIVYTDFFIVEILLFLEYGVSVSEFKLEFINMLLGD